jgi:hypothetical protein
VFGCTVSGLTVSWSPGWVIPVVWLPPSTAPVGAPATAPLGTALTTFLALLTIPLRLPDLFAAAFLVDLATFFVDFLAAAFFVDRAAFFVDFLAAAFFVDLAAFEPFLPAFLPAVFFVEREDLDFFPADFLAAFLVAMLLSFRCVSNAGDAWFCNIELYTIKEKRFL